jgi:hypothetical protein
VIGRALLWNRAAHQPHDRGAPRTRGGPDGPSRSCRSCRTRHRRPRQCQPLPALRRNRPPVAPAGYVVIGFDLGVRPNSPTTTTSVFFSRPRSCKSSSRADKPLIESRHAQPSRRIPCRRYSLAHPAAVHVPGKTRGPALGTLARATAPAIDTHKATPDSTSRRAMSRYYPRGWRP